MDIYVDVLFLENIVMNYIILVATAKFSKMKTSNLRLLSGAFIGAVYVVLMVVLPGIKVYYTIPGKVILSVAIIAVAFSPDKIKVFFKTLILFYISTFIFAGASFAFLYFNNQNGGFVKNGIFYMFWQSKWTVVFLAIITAAIILKIFWDIFQYRFVKDKLLVRLKIWFENKATSMGALVDTGNSLKDPLTSIPVVIVEFRAIREILPPEIRNIFTESKENDLNAVTSAISTSSWLARFRLIPFTSLGQENGMLIGFKPDHIEIGEESDKKDINDVIVGIYNRALSKSEEYRALLGPDII